MVVTRDCGQSCMERLAGLSPANGRARKFKGLLKKTGYAPDRGSQSSTGMEDSTQVTTAGPEEPKDLFLNHMLYGPF